MNIESEEMDVRLSYKVRSMRVSQPNWEALESLKIHKRMTWNRLMGMLLAVYNEQQDEHQ